MSSRLVSGLLPAMSADPALADVWVRLWWSVGLPAFRVEETAWVYPHGLDGDVLVSLVGDLLDAGECECVVNALVAGASSVGVEKVLSRPQLRERLAAGVFGARGMDLWWVLRRNSQVSDGELAWWCARLRLVGPSSERFDEELDDDPWRVTSCCTFLARVDGAGRPVEDFPYRVGDFSDWDRLVLGDALGDGAWLAPGSQAGLERVLGPFLVDRFGSDLESWVLFFEFAEQGSLQDVLDLVDAVRAG